VKIAGMIFAAGESTRMGRDKALLDFQGSTFLNRLITLFLPRVDPLIVVLGHHATPVRETISANPSHPAALQVVINEHYKQGMLSSFQAGIRALPPDVSAALFTLVDHPAVRESTLDQLLAAFEREQPLLVIPRYEGQRGHPVVAERTILNEILSLPADASPKNVIRAHRAETVFVDVDDRGVVTDVDLPEEYDELRASS
jgi:molybdenum cofactor cytidylyltransferase